MDEELNELHVMDDQTRVAMLRIGSDDGTPFTKYILSDHLGSSNVILETDGSVYNREEYYPFGETSFGAFGKKRYRYVGKEKDEESGLYYYGARYFQPWSCRFISVDPQALKYGYQSSYAYADNNPINKMDHNGEGTGEGTNQTQAFTKGEADNLQSTAAGANSPAGDEDVSTNPAPETDLTKKGPAWKHKHKWSDIIKDKETIAKYGEGFKKGKTTYADLYKKRAPAILKEKLGESGKKVDCANLAMETLIEFASFYGLPVYMTDYRVGGKTFDSKSTEYSTPEKFSEALQETFGAATLFSEFNPALETISWKNIRPGDIMAWKFNIAPWSDETDRSWHINTITSVTEKSITVIQGGLEGGAASEITQKTYDRNKKGEVDPSFYTSFGVKDVKARRWNFDYFDNRK